MKKLILLILLSGCERPKGQTCSDIVAKHPDVQAENQTQIDALAKLKINDVITIEGGGYEGHTGVVMKKLKPIISCYGDDKPMAHLARAVIYVKALEPIKRQEQIVVYYKGRWVTD